MWSSNSEPWEGSEPPAVSYGGGDPPALHAVGHSQVASMQV